ncbi:MAG: aromatic ring-hydroxylating dioxygenase subunit alpha [Caulobacteraceae bacterium]|nr:aromatic ring-hydroxylating dioxygenase subunit alpha [Caulobacteraceae bacterium]
MTATAAPSISDLIARRKAGHSLEADFYTRPDIFQADLELIFGRHWIYVGVEPDVPEAGDVAVVDIGAASVLIVRDDDMRIRAFHNVCRHRGARLISTPKAVVGNLVCRYHAWTYSLDGKLIFADHMGEGFDPGCHGLKPVHLRSIAGLLFICLAEEPPKDIEALAEAMTPYLTLHDLPNTKIAKSVDLIERGNWKLTMENNRECYHCGANHPELTIPLFAYGFGFSPNTLDEGELEQAKRYEALVKDAHARWEAAGAPSREIEHLADRITGFRTERLPIDQSGQSQTMDTKVASKKLLGQINDPAMGGLSFWTQPNSWHHFMSDHIVTFSAIPLSPTETLVRTKWLVHKDAVEGVDYDLDNLTGVWEATNRQDADLVEITQAGVANPAYEPGPYSPYTEGLVEKFAEWYLARLAANLPEAVAA